MMKEILEISKEEILEISKEDIPQFLNSKRELVFLLIEDVCT